MSTLLLFPVLAEADWDNASRQAWADIAAPNDAFDFDVEPGLALQPGEQMEKLKAALGRWLGYRRYIGLDDRAAFDLLDEVSAVEGFVRQLQFVAPCTARGYVTSLRTVAMAMAPRRNFVALNAAFKYLWRTARPTKDKASLIIPAREMFDFGLELMASSARRTTELKQAGQYRDGLVISLLMASTVRLKNLNSIEIGRHLIMDGGKCRLTFPANEMKAKRALELPLPIELFGWLDEWLEVYRPALLDRRGGHYQPHDGSRLWISDGGAPYRNGKQLGVRIVGRTTARFGKAITAHVFRDIAATSIAIEQSENVGIIKNVLGHADVATGQRYYNQASSFSAGLAYLEAIKGLRRGPAVGASE